MGADYDMLGRLRLVPERLLAGCYLDLGHHISDTTLVVATGRSGSTWVAELINHRHDHRLVFEPFRADRVRKARPFLRGHYIERADQENPLGGVIDALLAGRVRTFWTDRQNRKRIARRRIVKEVRLTNLLPWIRTRHPSLRIVYVVRDPVAVARSWLELGWGDDLDELLEQPRLLARFADIGPTIDEFAGQGKAFERHVLRWCLENAIPLREHRELDLHLVAYERLHAQPEGEVERLFAYLGRETEGAFDAVPTRSVTAGFPKQRRFDVSDDQRRRAREIVALFGLDELTPMEGGERRA